MILKLQVMLDRAHASPGVIDGYNGDNVSKAVAAVEAMLGLPVDGIVRQRGLEHARTHPFGPSAHPIMQSTDKDVAGPFVPEMPKDYGEMAKLDRLAYRDPVELLAEKFHMDESLLRQLNPGATSPRPEPPSWSPTSPACPAKVAQLVADKGKKRLLGFDAAGTLVVSYPATIGSNDLPSPEGSHLVKTIATDPEYWYRPKVNFQQGDNTQALRLAPGPNNPVGSAWIGLDKPTYGIHGTPAPNKIDKTSSHGCIRLTNWDVRELAKLVQPGVVVDIPRTADAGSRSGSRRQHPEALRPPSHVRRRRVGCYLPSSPHL